MFTFIIILGIIWFVTSVIKEADIEKVSTNITNNIEKINTKLAEKIPVQFQYEQIDKHLHIHTKPLPQELYYDICQVEIFYENQQVSSFQDCFANQTGHYIGGSNRRPDNSIHLVVPLNALILPRNRPVNLTFKFYLLRNRQVIDKYQFKENITISNKPYTEIEWFTPLLDILAYYFIKNQKITQSNKWSSSDVQHIKAVFKPLLTDKQDLVFLKEYLKYLNNPATTIDIYTSVDNYNARGFPQETSHILIEQIAINYFGRLQAGETLDIDTLANELKALANYINVDRELIFEIITELYRVQNGGNAHDFANQGMSRIKALEILGLTESATKEEIKRAYRLKIKDFHPDKYQSSPQAIKDLIKEKSQEINEAKDILLG